jgi:hypothetical protein
MSPQPAPLPVDASDAQASPTLRRALRRLESADAAGDGEAWTRAVAQVAWCYQAAGDPERAEWHLRQGLRRARKLGRPAACLDALCDMSSAALAAAVQHDVAGEADLARRARDRLRDYCFEAARLAMEAGAPPLQAAVLMRLADLLYLCGDRDDARALQQRAQQLLHDDIGATAAGPL